MKSAIKTVRGRSVPMLLDDIDTDIIIPAQYLTQTSKSGYGQHAFARLRQADPDFVLNQPAYQGAKVLLAGANFGCGSSREHAVWAIQEMGIEAVIAPSFADIFSNNAQKNHLPLITLSAADCQRLAQLPPAQAIEIDLLRCTIAAGDAVMSFAINPFFQHVLTAGIDELDHLLAQQAAIQRFHAQQQRRQYFVRMPRGSA
ncbi:3-isopropylmalate dehydratase small subunit [Marinicella meishanensis]|uniref:3-isopropylmalate dehydratase small subunit n=1 Tax=Marinicella meishanensis TaxID=2873263 RepID=UPI001CC01B87|nr:3-isopropylmalate dehydratase small subunit [Marinicella sp. NBU2979]